MSTKPMKLFSFLADIIFPNRCPFCREVIAWNENICDGCATELEYCSDPIRHLDDSLMCVSLCYYEGLAKLGVLHLKYDCATNLPDFFANKLADRVIEVFGLPDLITCVPASSGSRRERGYNQAALIAKTLSKELSVPLDCKLISKKNKSVAQHTLSSEERILNAKNTYFKGRSNRPINGMKVLLCDDVVTTGATLCECAKVLKSLGAAQVVCATLTNTKLYSAKEGESDV